MIRTRFAPSPTGYLHVGGARTALFNWLLARHHGGRFILRVEDTDAARNTEEAVAAIYEGMRWLGLDWDEGPDVGGACGPYRQSERRGHYDEWFDKLQRTGRVYEDGGAWRFRFDRRPVTVPDLVVGDVTMDYTNAANTPDMVVRRGDGSYVFHFVNVVDDIEMKISHVIRGDDHLPNTPKHLQLFEALGVEPPAYGHIPLILNPDGSKMAKRDEGASVRSYQDGGFIAPGVVNFLALLGWSPKDDTEILPIEDLIRRFNLDGVNRNGAVFNMEKCRWFSGRYLQMMAPDALLASAAPWFDAAGFSGQSGVWRGRVLEMVKEKIRTLGDLQEWLGFFQSGVPELAAEAREKAAADPNFARVAQALFAALDGIGDAAWSADSIKAAVAGAASTLGLKPGKLMFPLRIIATGATHGPDLAPMLELLGKNETLGRVRGILGAL